MVASTVKGQIDLSTLSVTGKATPAVKGGSEGAVIPAPAVAGQLLVVPPATKGEPLESRKPVEAAAPAAQTPAADAPAGQAKEQTQPPAAPPAPSAPPVELHGGTVPVPQQKVPGQ